MDGRAMFIANLTLLLYGKDLTLVFFLREAFYHISPLHVFFPLVIITISLIPR